MPHTTQCTQCGIRLNVPEEAAGRRLKCPKCGTKFLPDAPNPNAASSAMRPGIADASLDSMLDVAAIRSNPDLPVSSGELRKGGHGQADMPTASGDLRDTFDLPLLVDDDAHRPSDATGRGRGGIIPGQTRRDATPECRRGEGASPTLPDVRGGGPGRDVALQHLRPQPGDRSARGPG